MTFKFTEDTPDSDSDLVTLFQEASPATRSTFLRILALDGERRELYAALSELSEILGD
jgi:hypothetical protein